MGTYTELIIKCRIKSGISALEEKILFHLFDPSTPHYNLCSLPDHQFFQLPFFDRIGSSCSAYHIPSAQSYFDGTYLFSRSDLKNYEEEIQKFLDWVMPLIDEKEGTVIGWIWCENMPSPVLIKKQEIGQDE